jgi:hypothetical protein
MKSPRAARVIREAADDEPAGISEREVFGKEVAGIGKPAGSTRQQR